MKHQPAGHNPPRAAGSNSINMFTEVTIATGNYQAESFKQSVDLNLAAREMTHEK